MKKTMVVGLLLVVAFVLFVAFSSKAKSEPIGWVTNFEDAQKRAKAEERAN